jgi:uncharacterized protein YukE
MATKTVTPAEFKVDLSQFASAIQTVRAQASIIESACLDIKANMQGLQGVWNTPAALGFEELALACSKQMDALTGLLTEMVARMQAAYQNYLAVEEANTRNLQGGPKPPGHAGVRSASQAGRPATSPHGSPGDHSLAARESGRVAAS